MELFSVFKTPSFSQQSRGHTLGDCITEDADRAKAIQKAEDYFCNRAEEDSEYGAGERDAILVTSDDDGNESTEEIILRWHAEKDHYDGGRFDYYTSRM